MQVAVDISPGAYIVIIMLLTGEIIFETDKSENKKLCTGVKPSPSALRPCPTLRMHTYLIFICVIIISVYYNCCTTLVGVQGWRDQTCYYNIWQRCNHPPPLAPKSLLFVIKSQTRPFVCSILYTYNSTSYRNVYEFAIGRHARYPSPNT